MIWILFLGTFVTSLLAAARVKSNYLRFGRVAASSGLTGAEAALEILRHANIDDVEVIPHDGLLADHYDPLHKRLVLSTDNYFGRSVAALGVAAHEAGHAIQHAQAYLPLQLRMAAVGLTTFASQVVMWLPLFGMVTGLLSNRSDNVAHLSPATAVRLGLAPSEQAERANGKQVTVTVQGPGSGRFMSLSTWLPPIWVDGKAPERRTAGPR